MGRMEKFAFSYMLLGFLVSACMHPSAPFDEGKWRKQVESQKVAELYEPHFREGKYFNPWLAIEHGGFWQFLRWKFSRKADYTAEERAYKPDFTPGLRSRIQSSPPGDFIAWIGHSTFLIRLGGEYWLTDPIFSARAFLPQRIIPPAMTAGDLKGLGSRINVLISHDHYDHLDAESIRSHPEATRFFVPLGLKEYVASWHKGAVRELDWWESIDAGGGTQLICLPAQHWSRRMGQAANSTLWASYLLITPTTSIYFEGDSGYFIGYREFGRRFPGIVYALLSTTAYHPRWFMHSVHKNIPEALDAFRDLGAKYFIPTQWGTFHLGDEPPGYPALDLKKTIREKNLDPSRFLFLDIGGIERIPG
jgi:N-acyl-phosphatidylethanolamine-hydrolysing phospholipase D